MWPWLELVVLVVLNAVVDTIIVLYLQRRSFDGQLKQIWNKKVELEDLNGEIIKVPVTTIVKNKEGEEIEKVDMVVAPLWYTILYGAGSMAAQQVKMSLLSAKGKVARGLNTAALAGEASGIAPWQIAVIESLPNKWKGPAVALASLFNQNNPTNQGPGQNAQGQSQRKSGGFNPG